MATSIKINIVIILFLFGFCHVSAQDTDDTELPTIETIIEANRLIVSELEPQGQTKVHTLGSDAAYIYQIGANNSAAIRTYGNNNELKLVQNGDANTANIDVKGKHLLHHTVQNGNGNVFMEYGNASHLNLERQILQNGNNQNVTIYGSNSLTERIQLNVQGDAQALTIRSSN